LPHNFPQSDGTPAVIAPASGQRKYTRSAPVGAISTFWPVGPPPLRLSEQAFLRASALFFLSTPPTENYAEGYGRLSFFIQEKFFFPAVLCVGGVGMGVGVLWGTSSPSVLRSSLISNSGVCPHLSAFYQAAISYPFRELQVNVS